MITELKVSGYRSIRDLRLRLKPINVLTGPNGCGKSNLYQSIFLLAKAASNELARTLALEGGMPSALWVGARLDGPEQKRPLIGLDLDRPHPLEAAKQIRLSVSLDEFTYSLKLGLPTPDALTVYRDEPKKVAFPTDPCVKEESLWFVPPRQKKKVWLLERDTGTTWVRDRDGVRQAYPMVLSKSETAIAQIREPHLYPELAHLRETMANWRFYHHFRTDPEAVIRRPQIGSHTPILSHDGHDLAAALHTIDFEGDRAELARAIDQAFPGATLNIQADEDRARYNVAMNMAGITWRPLEANELSDGTLRYLCLLAALMSPRPASLIALNEPETSLHPDLLPPLARMIAAAGKRSQLWITTHSQTLAEAIQEYSGEAPIELEQVQGETRVVGQGLLD
jgi:predicted ATPase